MSAVASTSRHTLRAAARRPLQVLPSTSGRTFRAKHTSFHTPSDRPLRVLGIESSADDSCCAIVTSDRQILSNQVVKQHHINAKYGGIHPLRAQEGHAAGVPAAISAALEKARMSIQDVDAIAYTRGPGMYGCLAVGAASAQALAAAMGKPLLGIHHMQAHALTPLLTEKDPPEFPFLVLLVSGGHTQLVLARGIDKFDIIMDKVDNSMGDVFDKVARALGLPHSPKYGLGAVLEQYASRLPANPYLAKPLGPLPIPLKQPKRAVDADGKPLPVPADGIEPRSHTLAFSYSGLLTSTQGLIKDVAGGHADGTGLTEADTAEISRVFQEAAVQHLIMQLTRALDLPLAEARLSERTADVRILHGDEKTRRDTKEKLRDIVKGLVVSGGVAANKYLRDKLQDAFSTPQATATKSARPSIPLYYPPLDLCTAMIAWTAILRIQNGAKPESYSLPIRPKWSLEADLSL